MPVASSMGLHHQEGTRLAVSQLETVDERLAPMARASADIDPALRMASARAGYASYLFMPVSGKEYTQYRKFYRFSQRFYRFRMIATDERQVENRRMVDPQAFAQRFRHFRIRAELTLDQVAELVGVAQQSVSGWEAGSVPRPHRWEKISKVLKTTVEELFYGRSNPVKPLQTAPEFPIVELKGRVPLISWAQAGAWQEIQDTFHPGDAERWLQVSARVGAMSFAVRVVGDSMEPRVPAGSVVVIDPDKPAEHGAIVLAKRDGEQIATLKQLWYDGGTPYLRPLNDRYPTLSCPDDTRIIGVAVQVVLDL